MVLEVSDWTYGIGSQNGGFDDWTTNNHRWSGISSDRTANTSWQNDIFGFNRPPTLVFVRRSMSTKPSTLIVSVASLIIEPQAPVAGVETSNIRLPTLVVEVESVDIGLLSPITGAESLAIGLSSLVIGAMPSATEPMT